MIVANIAARYLPNSGVHVVSAPLRRSDPSSPWCYAASILPPIEAIDGNDASVKTSANMLPKGTNILATQVWPSSRIASFVLERHVDPSWTVCELGCGPGLPSLTAAANGAASVIATDVDDLALEMVQTAAEEQGLVIGDENDASGRFFTQKFDLTSKVDSLPEADLYVLSDVFESSAVAKGAAWHVQSVLAKNTLCDDEVSEDVPPAEPSSQHCSGPDVKRRVWVFAQSDRAQRDTFLSELRKNIDASLPGWTFDHAPDVHSSLWLFDLDETLVKYN